MLYRTACRVGAQFRAQAAPWTFGRTSLSAAALLVVLCWALPVWATSVTERVSVSSAGLQGNGESYGATISSDGRFVAFRSVANNLVPSDFNGKPDVFVRDRQTARTERVSVATDGNEANGGSYTAAISGDGRFVAFASHATNLVPGDTNGRDDIFVRDRQMGTTERVNLGPNGVQADMVSDYPAISSDGRFVSFLSLAFSLIPGDNNGQYDVFVRDRRTGTTARVSDGPGGVQGNGTCGGSAISAEGQYVAFDCLASNLVAGDNNDASDVFVHEQRTATTRLLSRSTGGQQGNGDSFSPAISAAGRFVAFASNATNLVSGDNNGQVDVFLRDRRTATTWRMSIGPGGRQGNGKSYGPAISANGRFVAFASLATNLVPNDTNRVDDVFVHDRESTTTRRVSVGSGGRQGNAKSYGPALSADGAIVAFTSRASNLVPEDTNNGRDVFVRISPP